MLAIYNFTFTFEDVDGQGITLFHDNFLHVYLIYP